MSMKFSIAIIYISILVDDNTNLSGASLCGGRKLSSTQIAATNTIEYNTNSCRLSSDSVSGDSEDSLIDSNSNASCLKNDSVSGDSEFILSDSNSNFRHLISDSVSGDSKSNSIFCRFSSDSVSKYSLTLFNVGKFNRQTWIW